MVDLCYLKVKSIESIKDIVNKINSRFKIEYDEYQSTYSKYWREYHSINDAIKTQVNKVPSPNYLKLPEWLKILPEEHLTAEMREQKRVTEQTNSDLQRDYLNAIVEKSR